MKRATIQNSNLADSAVPLHVTINTGYTGDSDLVKDSSQHDNNAPISPFVPVQTRAIPSLRLELQEFRHEITGARHFHFKSEHNENVFMVALRTVPTDSTGVAHILEHTTLCGSERFPVRDPFL